jgi:ribosomal protein S18 acetylase RimI-like enzyme
MLDVACVVIRPMRADDTAAVAGLMTQLGYPSTEEEIGRRFELIKDRPDTALLVASVRRAGPSDPPSHHDGSIVGWIHMQATCLLECDPRAEIWGLVVDESTREVGVGRRLVEAAEEWARGRGLDVIALRSNQLRTNAQGFYQHLGYTITKTQNAFRKHLA